MACTDLLTYFTLCLLTYLVVRTEELRVAAEERAPSHEPHGLCDLAPRELVVLQEAAGWGQGQGQG